MYNAINRDQLKQAIKEMVSQSELFPEQLNQQIETLDNEDLEKLTITLHVALSAEKKLTDEAKEELDDTLAQYLNGKARIYAKAQSSWIKTQEAKCEAQECLFEESLLAKL